LKARVLIVGLMFVSILAAAACNADDRRGDTAHKTLPRTNRAGESKAHSAVPPADSKAGSGHEGHNHGPVPEGVPAYIKSAAELKSLKPTLSPDLFRGRQRLGYQAAKEIPKTLAQLPCYCHCDKGFGHKSLQTCFVDDHAAHCEVCIDEALVAYRLEKEEGLKPEQIRERVIEQFSKR
jgi:hypothetical protein